VRRRALLTAALLLSGCGFKLRGAQQLPFSSVHLGFSANSPFGAELARTIRAGTSTRVVENANDAQAIIEPLAEAREREVLSVNAQGRAREYTLRLRVSFRVHDGKGRELLAATPLAASRELAFNESEILAKESEEGLLYRDMQTDLVRQVMRRLAAIKP
jgi:LPS-assembly lipoprotein